MLPLPARDHRVDCFGESSRAREVSISGGLSRRWSLFAPRERCAVVIPRHAQLVLLEKPPPFSITRHAEQLIATDAVAAISTVVSNSAQRHHQPLSSNGQ